MNGIKNTECPICLNNLLQVTLSPCGHMLCFNCSQNIEKCHFCDINIDNKIKNWISYIEMKNQSIQTNIVKYKDQSIQTDIVKHKDQSIQTNIVKHTKSIKTDIVKHKDQSIQTNIVKHKKSIKTKIIKKNNNIESIDININDENIKIPNQSILVNKNNIIESIDINVNEDNISIKNKMIRCLINRKNKLLNIFI